MTQTNQGADMIEQDIVQTQNDISDTVNELQEKLQPQQLMRQVVGNPQEMPGQVFEAVKRNPIAAGLIGVGVLWLLSGQQPKMPKLKSRKPTEPDFVDQQLASVVRYEGESEDVYQSRLAASQSDQGGLNGGTQSQGFGAKLGGLTQGLRDKAKNLGGGANGRLGGLTGSIKDRGRGAADWSSAKHSQEPLVTAVAAIAAGAVAGLALPKTQVEREKLAPLRDTAVAKATELKDQALQAAGDKLGGQTRQPAEMAG